MASIDERPTDTFKRVCAMNSSLKLSAVGPDIHCLSSDPLHQRARGSSEPSQHFMARRLLSFKVTGWPLLRSGPVLSWKAKAGCMWRYSLREPHTVSECECNPSKCPVGSALYVLSFVVTTRQVDLVSLIPNHERSVATLHYVANSGALQQLHAPGARLQFLHTANLHERCCHTRLAARRSEL